MKIKNRLKHAGIIVMLSLLALTLSGCVRTDANGHPYGFVYHYLALPGQGIMNDLAKYVGGLGWAIIVLTVIVRLILMPLMIKQIKGATVQQEKISLIQPQLKALQKQLKKASNQVERTQVSQAMMKLYHDNHISLTGGIGILPLLIQLPIFAALYAAIRYSPQLSRSQFLGISLGQKSFILAGLSFAIYVLQAYLSLIGVPKSQKKQMKIMMFFSPLMILFVTIGSPAGLGLYFFIGGIFACFQTSIINLYRPRIRKQIKADVKRHPVKPVQTVSNRQPKPTGPDSTNQQALAMHRHNRERNQGKQN